MFSLESLLFLAVAMLLVGIVIGVVIGRSWVPPQQQKEMEQNLKDAQKELESYQQNVAHHFLETSQKVTELTQSYRDLHQHLMKGVLELSNTEIGRGVLAAGEAADAAEPLENVKIEAPKDWAPKKPGEAGMLSEDFDLDKNSDDEYPDAPKV